MLLQQQLHRATACWCDQWMSEACFIWWSEDILSREQSPTSSECVVVWVSSLSLPHVLVLILWSWTFDPQSGCTSLWHDKSWLSSFLVSLKVQWWKEWGSIITLHVFAQNLIYACILYTVTTHKQDVDQIAFRWWPDKTCIKIVKVHPTPLELFVWTSPVQNRISIPVQLWNEVHTDLAFLRWRTKLWDAKRALVLLRAGFSPWCVSNLSTLLNVTCVSNYVTRLSSRVNCTNLQLVSVWIGERCYH